MKRKKIINNLNYLRGEIEYNNSSKDYLELFYIKHIFKLNEKDLHSLINTNKKVKLNDIDRESIIGLILKSNA